jgi:hypothetical protein
MNLKSFALALLAVVVLAVGAFLGLRESRHEVVMPPTLPSPPASQPRPKLPAPAIPPIQQAEANATPQPSRIKKMLNGEELLEIRPEQLDGYLAANHRNVASLLAAFRLTGNRAFLNEAAEQAPNDPRVAFESWSRTQDKAERQKLLETWERSNPNNALATYLAAANLFKSGMTDAALGKLAEAAGKSDFSYFARESVLDCEEAYEAAGYSDAEAKVAASMELPLPHLGELKGMSQNLADLAKAYRIAGDDASAQAALNIGFEMAGKMATEPSYLIEDLVQLAVQNNLLQGLDPNAPSGIPGKSVQQLQDEAKARREALKADAQQSAAIFQNLSDADLAGYCDRIRLFGERAAIEWFKQKFGPP